MKKFATRAIITSEIPDLSGNTTSDVVSPIHLSSTFAKADFENNILGHSYSRLSNPTREVIEKKLASLENAKHTICYGSGQAAETMVILSMLKSGDEVICFNDIYGGTRRLLSTVMSNFGIKTVYVDMTNIGDVKRAIGEKTKMIWMESPTNPFLTLCNIEEIAKIARDANVISVVDNTFATPYLQQPLNLGIDIVVHSMTKYINGHSDSVAGAVCLNDFKLYEKLRMVSNSCGAILSPFDSYLNSRGIKTLSLRMKKHCENALEIAKFLESHANVEKVFYPGLPSHPQHELAKTQMKNGFGGVVSAYLNTDYEGMKRFAKNLTLFTLAESLGGVESLYGMPYYMSHGSLSAETKKEMNITQNLLRFSIGIEDVEDLKEALNEALRAI
ncbi:cystathionine gamma-synthase [Helicobacter sp. 13S00401-1]|uniref:trans-sulfuration enzyme family protein n=1 Tax=Helicobacter sp. 13S00401-1 TaxID=1905758 RepID=UPI000BA5DB7E|nr:PLP-dependent aspartate aminotransferase family protein [Helicobacter sp. 13S00401-1]PAF50092.1 cystathionine gamma-synthase [Helicobacter sp. 13S00401-1]